MGDPLKEKVHVFGVGKDGVLSMNLKAMRLLQDAEWIFGPERLLAFFPNHDAKKIPIPDEEGRILNRPVLRSRRSHGWKIVLNI